MFLVLMLQKLEFLLSNTSLVDKESSNLLKFTSRAKFIKTHNLHLSKTTRLSLCK